MTYRLFIVACLFLCSPWLIAQKSLSPISSFELSQRQSLSFPGALAEILEENQQVYFAFSNVDGEFKVVEQVSRKIKIYDSNAASKASFMVDYVQNNYISEQVELLEAQVYHLQAGKVLESAVPKEWVMQQNLGNSHKQKGIDFSKVSSGSVIVYSYMKISNYIDMLPVWQIQSDLPKQKSFYQSIVPNYYEYNLISSGDIQIQTTKSTTVSDFSGSSRFLRATKVPSVQINMQAVDIAPYLGEPFSNNEQNYIAWVKQELVKLDSPYFGKQTILESEKDFINGLYDNKYFYGQIDIDSYYKKKLEKEAYLVLEPKDRAQKVLEFVQSKVKWDGDYSIYAQNGVKTAYRKGLGNSADINLMLISMLRYVDLEAYPVLLSTLSNGIKKQWQHNYFNNVIVGLKINQDYFFLDASSNISTLGILPIEDLNGVGMLVGKNPKEQLHFNMIPSFMSSSTYAYQLQLQNDGALKGSIRGSFQGYDQVSTSSFVEKEGKFGFTNMFEYVHNGLRLSNVNFTDLYSKDNSLRLNADVYKQHALLNFNNKIFFNAFDFFAFKNNPFTAKTRLADISWGYPSTQNYLVGVNLPKGYKVSSVPKGFTIQEKDLGLFAQTTISQTDNGLEVKLVFTRSMATIPAKDYAKAQRFFAELEQKLQEYVIFEVSK